MLHSTHTGIHYSTTVKHIVYSECPLFDKVVSSDTYEHRHRSKIVSPKLAGFVRHRLRCDLTLPSCVPICERHIFTCSMLRNIYHVVQSDHYIHEDNGLSQATSVDRDQAQDYVAYDTVVDNSA